MGGKADDSQNGEGDDVAEDEDGFLVHLIFTLKKALKVFKTFRACLFYSLRPLVMMRIGVPRKLYSIRI